MDTLNHHELAALAAVLGEALRRMQEHGEMSGSGYRLAVKLYEFTLRAHRMDAASFAHYCNHKTERAAALMSDDWGDPASG